MFGGIEAGGTKFVCGIGTGPGDLIMTRIPTTTPESTIPAVIGFFNDHASHLDAIGIGSFGPVELDPSSPHFGHITSTPKPGWANYGLAGAIESALGLPVGFDTDVNAALLGEARWGAAQRLPDFVYLTIGTGIGGAAMVNGSVLHGLVHTEMGHIRIPHDFATDPFPGSCPYHADCFEGLASGSAIGARWGKPAHDLPSNHPAWYLEAHYLALALVNFTVTLSPRRILIGGGVMRQTHLFELVRREFAIVLGGYIRHAVLDRLEEYIQAPQLGPNAGIVGTLVLAEQSLAAQRSNRMSSRNLSAQHT